MSSGRMRLAAFALMAGTAVAQTRAPLHLFGQPVRDKNFYLLSLVSRTPAVRAAMERDAALAKIAAAKREALRSDDAVAAMQWSGGQVSEAANALRSLYRSNAAVRQMVDGPLRASGAMIRYNSESGAEFLAHGWADAAQGINRAIRVYGAGAVPRYPDIDAIAFDVKSDSFARLLKVIGAVVADNPTGLTLFFEPSLRFATALLDASHRDEAGRLEPLESGENAAALRRMASVKWEQFAYSAILVPGSGTDRPEWSLSPFGALRLELAARRYREKKAPFLIVSGGYVHPNQTPYCEALEMKRALVGKFGIPADAIFVEPHSRHTTTNLRNAARELYRYGFPLGKKALITTDQLHSESIEAPAFAKRCRDELGFEPVTVGQRVSPFDLTFLPKTEALQMDSADPLDP